NTSYYKTDLGIVVKDDDSIRLKSAFEKTLLTQEKFDKSNPVNIKQAVYLQLLNEFFRTAKHEWVYKNTRFRKLENFEISEYG
ncbi:hypothetical protein OFL77_27520, partial [Escherichia coli]|uniref:hypothetical protein n=1 Tax=Escherichia coli TaxID=562 RepID=UPI0021DFC45D